MILKVYISCTKLFGNILSYLPPAKVMFLHVSVCTRGGEYLGRYPPEQCMLGDTGNKRAVRILLECILVVMCHRGRLTHLAFAYFSSHFTISSGDTLLLDKSMYPELYNIKKYRTPLNLLSLPQFQSLIFFIIFYFVALISFSPGNLQHKWHLGTHNFSFLRSYSIE